MVELASFSFERSLNELEAFQVGPYGLKRGREWSYIAKGAITGIMISCDDTAVVSYVFKGVDENGNVEYSDTFGYHYEDVTKIMLEWPQEYFTSLSGTYYEGFSNYYFSSLCFTTNRKKYGPFGYVTGTPFDFPTNGRVIVGFYGSVLSGEYHWTYGTLGVYVKHSTHLFGPSSQVIRSDFNKQECIKVGPWGWSRSITEKEWSYMLKGGAITEMKIGYNRDSIKWIAFKSLDENADQEVIPLNWPKEYLVSISGTLRASIGDIESLCFYTNRTIYGPFGTMEGTPFSFNMKGGIIVGFYGRVGDYFDALGAYIKPFSEFFGSLGQGQIENTRVEARTYGGRGGKEWVYKPNNGAITQIKITHSRSIDSLYFKSVDENKNSGYSDEFDDEGGDTFLVGPYGVKRGREWSYIAKGAITGIMISCDENVVVSYVFKGVDENGNVEYSDTFGYHYEDVSKIMINWPEEYFTSLNGTYYQGQLNYYFSSLCFTTNRKKYGPFGQPRGTPFDFPMNGRVIAGFYGSVLSDEYHWTYGTLGVYVKHSTHLFSPSSQVQLVEPKTEVIRSDFNKQECIKVGPWGWSRSITEEEWSYMLKGGAITEMKIGYNRDSIKSIDSLCFKSVDENEKSENSDGFDDESEVTSLIKID
ncbi:hypothetical protein JRO89_XS09G0225100 [Xanthoceras sorbifolium]|uniref:Jacalin-type lectin domain-containing protein n=1 Tax=Xanthoceras sorbifolium TaxID=99658 RepID=A0ABQ8HMF3_9ROSI|nr:hypothetical protein JRO89_XS09G0225100 [Xanthoceras sorbifolium]